MYELEDALIRLEELTDDELLLVLSSFLGESESNLIEFYPKRLSQLDMIHYLLTMTPETEDDIDLKNDRIKEILLTDWSEK